MTAHSMSRDEWARIKRVASDVWARPVEDRARYIDEACAGDGPLRAEVVSLVESMEQAGERFETPALAMPASGRAAADALLASTIVQPGTRIAGWTVRTATRQRRHGYGVPGGAR